MTKSNAFGVLVLIIVLSCSSGATDSGTIQPLVKDTFDTDSQGWAVSKGGISGFSPTGGYPGGFFYGDDATGPAWYFVASKIFVTKARKSYGRTLSFTLRQTAPDSKPGSLYGVILSDSKRTLTFNTGYNPATTWTSYSIRLDELSGWQKGSSRATKSDIQNVIQSLTDLRIRGDFKAGSVRGGIDNVSIY